jgi:aminoglycoside 2'-N-acetyltransferase I
MQIEVQPPDVAYEQVCALMDSVWTPEKEAVSVWRDIVTADTLQRVLVRDDDGQLVSHVGIFLGDATLGERAVRIGGIGGVCTREGSRRKGFALAGMARAATYIKEELAADFGLLFCNEANYRFYEICGWTRFPGEVFVEQPAGRIAFTISAPYILGFKMLPAHGMLDLHGLPW